jgi:hypothetical protein
VDTLSNQGLLRYRPRVRRPIGGESVEPDCDEFASPGSATVSAAGRITGVRLSGMSERMIRAASSSRRVPSSRGKSGAVAVQLIRPVGRTSMRTVVAPCCQLNATDWRAPVVTTCGQGACSEHSQSNTRSELISKSSETVSVVEPSAEICRAWSIHELGLGVTEDVRSGRWAGRWRAGHRCKPRPDFKVAILMNENRAKNAADACRSGVTVATHVRFVVRNQTIFTSKSFRLWKAAPFAL